MSIVVSKVSETRVSSDARATVDYYVTFACMVRQYLGCMHACMQKAQVKDNHSKYIQIVHDKHDFNGV